MAIPATSPSIPPTSRQKRHVSGAGRSPPRAVPDPIDFLKWSTFQRSPLYHPSDFRPEWLGDKLSQTLLINVLDGGHDYRILIEGSAVIKHFAAHTGNTYREIYTSVYLAELLPFLDIVLSSCRPAQQTFTVTVGDGTPITFSQLAMPAVSNSGLVRRIAIVIDMMKTQTEEPTLPMFA